MQEATTLTVQCLCGASKFSTDIPTTSLPLDAHMCHCNSCRHVCGTLCYMAIDWPESEPEDTSTLTAYAFSEQGNTYFCTTCGTNMFWQFHGEPKFMAASTGALKDAGRLVDFKNHCWVADTKDSGFSDWVSLKKYTKNRDSSEELPKWWKTTEGHNEVAKANEDTQEAYLPAYCLCRGVEFYITRPNEASKEVKSDLPDVWVGPAPSKDIGPWFLSTHGRYLAGTCSCNTCRLAAGIDIVQWAFVPALNIKLPNGEDYRTDFGTLKSYSSREDVMRYFCGRCGALVFWTGTAREELIDVAVGLLDSASGARAEDWLDWAWMRVSYTEDAPNQWLVGSLAEGLKEWKTYKGHDTRP